VEIIERVKEIVTPLAAFRPVVDVGDSQTGSGARYLDIFDHDNIP
jgi:hypothetical protein